MRPLFLPVVFLLFLGPLSAQTVEGPGFGIICSMQDTAAAAYLSPAAAILSGSAARRSAFDLNFSSDVPAEARAAFTFAADIWGAYLNSTVPIRVDIEWEDREDNRLLASAGPGTLFRGFPGSEPNVWYPVALAEAIAGDDLNDPTDADINVNANSTANWYFGTDGNTPRNRIDLVSVVLHELGHGLGFLSSVDTVGTEELAIGFGGRFIVYDLFLETETNVPLTDENMFGNPSRELLRAVTRDNLFFDGALAVREFGEEVPMFAPSTFDNGSSVSHLSEREFRAGTENALMTPFLSAGEAVHDPGPITLGIFADIGWDVVFDLPSSTETAAATLAVVYPNPASGPVRIELPPGAGTVAVEVVTIDGRSVRRQPVPAGAPEVSLDLGDLPAGTYLLVGRGRVGWRQALVLR